MARAEGRTKELNMELADMRRNPYLVDYSRTARVPKQKPSSGSRRRDNYTVVNGGAGRRSANQGNAYASEDARARQHRNVYASEDARVRQYRNTYAREDARARQRRYARQQARRRRLLIQRCIVIMGSMICFGLLFAILYLQGGTQAAGTPKDESAVLPGVIEPKSDEQIQGLAADVYNTHPNWTEDFLTLNEYSRPGDPLSEVNSIFVHYTANPGTSAAQNRSYFESLKDTQERSASAHFIIGYNGEIIQCIPLDEIAYAVQTRNEDSISIECCFLAENGAFTQETYDSLVSLLGWLTDAYDLKVDDILRHYDCGGKKCPLYYTEHPDAWEQLKQDVKEL
ncbi:MAG: N-acetylmuramoyl-L-alanine amidase [Candidatus Gastranaerophilales bacterium]|nr:N-acetylmuramoyl-L-alanine amidase [Candidatus Gastranaerophilales bacterium]